MSVNFRGVDRNRPRSTPFGEFPGDVDLGERFEFLSFASVFGRAILDLLGLASDDLTGSATLPEFRRALIRARSTFDRRAVDFVEPTRVESGRPVDRGGIVELRPVRVVWGGIDIEGLDRRLALLEEFAVAAVSAGVTDIAWS
jgi:hypothetical protein